MEHREGGSQGRNRKPQPGGFMPGPGEDFSAAALDWRPCFPCVTGRRPGAMRRWMCYEGQANRGLSAIDTQRVLTAIEVHMVVHVDLDGGLLLPQDAARLTGASQNFQGINQKRPSFLAALIFSGTL